MILSFLDEDRNEDDARDLVLIAIAYKTMLYAQENLGFTNKPKVF